MSWLRALPLPRLGSYQIAWLRPDLTAGLAVGLLSVPQGLAYAAIAGLPPVMGLYAAAIPAMVGSLLRSSRHVIVGPSNALSLLVGAGLLSSGLDAPSAALTLALLAGLFQIAAGFLQLGTLLDYVSGPVVRGYITGAALLIGLGQLPNLLGTAQVTGSPFARLSTTLGALPKANLSAVLVGVATLASMLLLRWVGRRWDKRLPDALIGLCLGSVLGALLPEGSLTTLGESSPIPSAPPPFTLPDLSALQVLWPLGIAVAVLSLIEASAIERSLASGERTRKDASVDFVGQGAANLAAAFFGGYPVSGSLARSALAASVGSRSRVAGIASGLVIILLIVVFAGLLEQIPFAALAGLLLVLASDLIDPTRIRRVVSATGSDALAFGTTLVATLALRLDQAVAVGVTVSLVLYLRKARLLNVTELGFDQSGELFDRKDNPDKPIDPSDHGIRVLHLEGELFFGATGELVAALDKHLDDPRMQVLILRLKRAKHLDSTVARIFETAHRRLRTRGAHLILCGIPQEVSRVLETSGVAAVLGKEQLFPTQSTWFEALKAARMRARELRDLAALQPRRAEPPSADETAR